MLGLGTRRSPVPPGTVLLLFVWGRSEARRTEAFSPACHGGPDLSVAQSSQAPGWGHLTSLLPTFSSGGVGRAAMQEQERNAQPGCLDVVFLPPIALEVLEGWTRSSERMLFMAVACTR